MYNEEESIYDMSVADSRLLRPGASNGYRSLGNDQSRGAHPKAGTGRRWRVLVQRKALNPLLRRFPFLYSYRHFWRKAAYFFLLFLPLTVYLILGYLVPNAALPIDIANSRSALLVIAHPDDECLFFSPVLNRLKERSSETRLSILTMSVGNNYGIGDLRKKELHGSCAAFGVPEERCIALDDADFQDNPQQWWPTEKLRQVIDKYVDTFDVDLILTFDEGGISGHINHRAVSTAVREYVLSKTSAPAAYSVYTTTLLRKYTMIFDLGFTSLRFLPRILKSLILFSAASSENSSSILVNSLGKWANAVSAFKSHASQWSWDRSLFLVLNRYMWYNVLQRVE